MVTFASGRPKARGSSLWRRAALAITCLAASWLGSLSAWGVWLVPTSLFAAPSVPVVAVVWAWPVVASLSPPTAHSVTKAPSSSAITMHSTTISCFARISCFSSSEAVLLPVVLISDVVAVGSLT